MTVRVLNIRLNPAEEELLDTIVERLNERRPARPATLSDAIRHAITVTAGRGRKLTTEKAP